MQQPYTYNRTETSDSENELAKLNQIRNHKNETKASGQQIPHTKNRTL